MKPAPPPLTVGTPCPKRWAELTGDDKCRFCDQCQLHVHNLSAMSSAEREQFVTSSGGNACVAYELRPDGTMITPSRWSSWLLRFPRFFKFTGLASLLPFLFASCTTRRTGGSGATLGVPLPPPNSQTSAAPHTESCTTEKPQPHSSSKPHAHNTTKPDRRPMTLGKIALPKPDVLDPVQEKNEPPPSVP